MGIRSQNNPLAAYLDVFSNTGTDAAAASAGGNNFGAPQGLTATGGVVSDYVDGDEVYRAHVFTSSGTFAVTDSTSDFPLSSKILVVAGGGGGGGGPNWAGGGGAGGLLEATAFTLAQRSYPIVIGSGGVGGLTNSNQGGDGVNTVFTDPGGSAYTANGGGGGGAGNSPKDGRAGGSGGGSADNDPTFGPSTQSPASPFTGYGANGGGPGGSNGSSGGGGAGSPSTRSVSDKYPGTRYVTGTTSAPLDSPSVIGHRGRPNTFAYGPANPQVYAGGGGGGFFDWDGPGATSGAGVLNPTNSITDMNSAPANGGGGGKGGSYYQGVPIAERSGTSGTGGGGGGGIETSPRSPKHPNAPQPAVGGNGGSGTVVVAYQIGRLTAAAKATGGAISFYNGKTIHAFTNSGTFNAPASISDVEYVLIGGGGGGNSSIGGGGGSGAFVYSNGSPETITLSANPYPVVIGAGGNIGTPDNQGQAGGDTIWNGYTAGGGGGGQRNSPDTNTVGRASSFPQGSRIGAGGGGGCGNGSEAGASGATGGYAGGNGNDPSLGSGGGGGSGGAGGNAPSNVGGLGRQLPSTFRNPVSVTALGYPGPTGSVPATNPGGDTSGKYWVAGGGGGGARGNGGGQSQNGGDGGGGSGAVGGETPVIAGYDFTGAGIGVGNNHPGKRGGSAGSNSGSGGGGGRDGGSPDSGGHGGSGLLLIAYPS